MRRILLALALAAAACVRPVATPPRPTAQMLADSAAADSVAAAWFAHELAPGMAVAVVRGTDVIMQRGYGFADVEARRPVTPQTMFYIASVTKAFTGTAAALLAHRGQFDLDAPMTRYLPTARLREPLRADSTTIRLMLGHASGIGDGPVVWRLAFSGERSDNASLIPLLQEQAVRSTPPGVYAYGNIGYNIAAMAMDAATGRSWKDLLATELFAPLGMVNTTAHVSRVAPERLAMPYRINGRGFDRLPYMKRDGNMQSAGGLVSSASDMARWLEAHLNAGVVDGRQVIPAAVIAESHRAQSRPTGEYRGLRQVGYAMGWQMVLRGTDTLYTHGGGFAGFGAHAMFLPAKQIGIVVLANDGDAGTALVEVVAREILQRIAGEVPGAGAPPGFAANLAVQKANIIADRERRAQRPQVMQLPFEAYAGTYEHPTYGTMQVSVRDGRLHLRAGAVESMAEVFDGTRNMIRVELTGEAAVVPFDVVDGRPVRLTFQRVVYSRRP